MPQVRGMVQGSPASAVSLVNICPVLQQEFTGYQGALAKQRGILFSNSPCHTEHVPACELPVVSMLQTGVKAAHSQT